MRKAIGMVLFFAIALACAGVVMAQGGGGRGPGGPGGGMMAGPGAGMMVLFGEEARNDIGLSDEQSGKIRDIMREGMRPQEGVRFPGPDATDAQREEFRATMEKRMEETRSKVKDVFTAEQLKKVQTLSLQAGGYGSLGMNPFAQEALGLTDEQKTKIRDFQRQNMQEMMAANRPGRGLGQMSEEERQEFFRNMQTRMEENRKKMEENVKSVLTDEQKAKAEEIIKATPKYIEDARQRGPGNRGFQRGEGRGERRGGYRPGADSWQPGQGAGGERSGSRPRGGGFPRGGNRNN